MNDPMCGFWITCLLACLIAIPLSVRNGRRLLRGHHMRRRSFEYYRWLDMINFARIALGLPTRKDLTADDERRIGYYYLAGVLVFALGGVISLVALFR